jgi:hypothetical protein
VLMRLSEAGLVQNVSKRSKMVQSSAYGTGRSGARAADTLDGHSL